MSFTYNHARTQGVSHDTIQLVNGLAHPSWSLWSTMKQFAYQTKDRGYSKYLLCDDRRKFLAGCYRYVRNTILLPTCIYPATITSTHNRDARVHGRGTYSSNLELPMPYHVRMSPVWRNPPQHWQPAGYFDNSTKPLLCPFLPGQGNTKRCTATFSSWKAAFTDHDCKDRACAKLRDDLCDDVAKRGNSGRLQFMHVRVRAGAAAAVMQGKVPQPTAGSDGTMVLWDRRWNDGTSRQHDCFGRSTIRWRARKQVVGMFQQQNEVYKYVHSYARKMLTYTHTYAHPTHSAHLSVAAGSLQHTLLWVPLFNHESMEITKDPSLESKYTHTHTPIRTRAYMHTRRTDAHIHTHTHGTHTHGTHIQAF